MSLLKKAEDSLADIYKGAPKMSDSSQETVVKVWPWLALIGGALQLLSAFWLFSWARTADSWVNYANDVSVAFGGSPVVDSRWSVWVWLAIAVLVVDGVILLLAYPKLVKRLKAGWDLLLLAGLINVAYAVVSLFLDGRGGIGSLVWSLLVSAVMFYLLFAVRGKYKGAGHSSAPKK